MSTTSPINGLPIPDDDSPNDPPIHFGAIVGGIDDRMVTPFPSVTERDAAFAAFVTAGGTMRSGMMCVTELDGRFWRWSVSAATWAYAGGQPGPIAAVSSIGTGYTAASGFAPGCYKNGDGEVCVIGGVLNGGPYTPSGNVLFTLPTGFRPAVDIAAEVMVPAGTGFALGGVYSTGAVKINVGPTIGSSTLHTVNFRFHPKFAGGALA